jgi:uncharacterized membrane protein YedE/YeeE
VKSKLAALAAGALFAVGLGVSGMTQPAKVQGFLDVTGAWDASLAFVMVGAVGVHAVLRRLIARRPAPLLAPAFVLAPPRRVDGRLLAGSALFGIGWGLGGYCPGPGFVSAGGLSLEAVLFVAAMTGGILIFRFVHQPAASAAQKSGFTGSRDTARRRARG